MSTHWNTIHRQDCIDGMNALPAGSVDLAFADPPFNIGYDYDVYRDKLARDQYLAWSRAWIAAVHRALKDDGTFWLAIGDEYAAELKLASQDVGFHSRGWIIWYYTFGVNCDRKFTRSHAHLFYFVKDPNRFTFRADDLENRIPSARQLVYNDARANPKGRLPDDTWIIRPASVVGELADDSQVALANLSPPHDDEQTWTLRPQDLAGCFTRDEDTWYFPRVAGTFKERAGFHGCQMPEQLLGRIIRACSHEGELVLDPFSGSATTLAVAKKLGRRYLGYDISQDYIDQGQQRLAGIHAGDMLDGSAEPLMSAPKTSSLTKSLRKHPPKDAAALKEPNAADTRHLAIALAGITEAFRRTHRGFSVDRLVVDPELNTSFVDVCRELGIAGDTRTWNLLLFRLRKAGKLVQYATTERTAISWSDCDPYLFASEIALQIMLDQGDGQSLDEILCDPFLAATFDGTAGRFAPGYSSLEYRWAALKLRKQARLARSRGAVLKAPSRLTRSVPLEEFELDRLPERPGIYLLSAGKSQRLFAGEALNLRERLTNQFSRKRRGAWSRYGEALSLQTHLTETIPGEMLAWESCLARKFKTRLNYRELTRADESPRSKESTKARIAKAR